MFKTKFMVGVMVLLGFLIAPNSVSAADTLQDKIDAAEKGAVITLDKDYDEYLTITKDITIDLAGHKITANEDGWELINIVSAKLTIKDSKGNGKIVQTEGGNAIQLNVDYDAEDDAAANATEGKATLVLESGTIESNEFGVSLYNNSEFIMNGGKIISTGDETYAVCGNGTTNIASSNYGNGSKITINGGTIESNDYAIYSPQKDGVTTINGGTITGTAGAIGINRGTLIINGGTLISLGTDNQFSQNVAGVDGMDFATNAVVAIPAKYATGDEKVIVKIGGTAKLIAKGNAEVISNAITKSEENAKYIEASEANANTVVTGGTFSGKIDEKYISSGMNLVKNADGTYSVKKESTVTNNNNTTTQKTETVKNPQTADNLLLFIALSLLSVTGLTASTVYLRKQTN